MDYWCYIWAMMMIIIDELSLYGDDHEKDHNVECNELNRLNVVHIAGLCHNIVTSFQIHHIYSTILKNEH